MKCYNHTLQIYLSWGVSPLKAIQICQFDMRLEYNFWKCMILVLLWLLRQFDMSKVNRDFLSLDQLCSCELSIIPEVWSNTQQSSTAWTCIIKVNIMEHCPFSKPVALNYFMHRTHQCFLNMYLLPCDHHENHPIPEWTEDWGCPLWNWIAHSSPD